MVEASGAAPESRMSISFHVNKIIILYLYPDLVYKSRTK